MANVNGATPRESDTQYLSNGHSLLPDGDETQASSSYVVKHCLVTGERCAIEPGPTWEDRRIGFWRYLCPSCGDVHEESFRPHVISQNGPTQRKIDIEFKVDLGELISGHHIVARGLQLRTPWGSLFHYDCVPAMHVARGPDLDMNWGLSEVVDDVGTLYRRPDQGEWLFDPDADVNHGDWHLGNGIPASATVLIMNYHQAHRGLPEDSLSRSLHVALATGDARVRCH